MKPSLALSTKNLPYLKKHTIIDHREINEKFRQSDYHKHKVLVSTMGSVQLLKPPRYSPINKRNKNIDFKTYNTYMQNSRQQTSPIALTQTN